jgi:hypothetical protein
VARAADLAAAPAVREAADLIAPPAVREAADLVAAPAVPQAVRVAAALEVPLVAAMAAAVVARPGAVLQRAMALTAVVHLAAMRAAGRPAEPVAAARVRGPAHRHPAAHIAVLAERQMTRARPGAAPPDMADPMRLVAQVGAAA